MDEKTDEGVFQRFGHMKRMENDRIAKKVYVGECAGSLSVGKLTDTVKGCLEKRFGCQVSNKNGGGL